MEQETSFESPVEDGAGFGDRPLDRPNESRMLAGVSAGVAEYLDLDVTIVRIIFVVLALVGGLGIPLYLAGWLLMPDRDTGWSIADHLMAQARHFEPGSSRH